MGFSGDASPSGDWLDKSKCLQLSTQDVEAIFFPPPGGKSKRASEFCRGCPVRSFCLTWAIESGAEGFWAGTTESERSFFRTASRKASLSVVESDSAKRRPKYRSVTPTFPDRSFDHIEGPSPIDEMSMFFDVG